MYLGVLKFTLEIDTYDPSSFKKDAKALCEGIRTRFKVIARSQESPETYIAVSALAESEAALDGRFESILRYTEEKGMGRILDDQRLISPLMELFEDADDE